MLVRRVMIDGFDVGSRLHARTSSRRRDEANVVSACATRETRGRAVGRTPGPRHARAVVSRCDARRLALLLLV